MGGMQATEWAIDYADITDSIINIASPLAAGPDAIGYNLIMRMAILNDPDFNGATMLVNLRADLLLREWLG